MEQTPSLSSLIFSNAHSNFSDTLKSLSARKNSIHSRLLSIRHDAAFVHSVPETLGLDTLIPLVANARAGTWYIDPSVKCANAYFKSTDGHHLNWSFSTRRLNLHLLPILGDHGQVMIVDSTRRGKVMPDALSKTIPMWAAVMNRVLFPEKTASHALFTSAQAVGASEHTQVEDRLPEFVGALERLELDWGMLRKQLRKPMRPVFVSPDMERPSVDGLHGEWNVLVLVSASRLESGDVDDGYVQGAADDAENWAMGLTAELFWPNMDYLLDSSIGHSEVEDRVEEIVQKAAQSGGISNTADSTASRHNTAALRLSQSSTPFYIVTLKEAGQMTSSEVDLRILCLTELPANKDEDQACIASKDNDSLPLSMKLYLPSGKLGSRALRDALPRVAAFVTEASHKYDLLHPRIVYACANGRDISIGVAVAMISLFYDDDGNFTVHDPSSASAETQQSASSPNHKEQIRNTGRQVDKTFIRQRLVQIQSQMTAEGAGPSRSTLNAVNSFLMTRPG